MEQFFMHISNGVIMGAGLQRFSLRHIYVVAGIAAFVFLMSVVYGMLLGRGRNVIRIVFGILLILMQMVQIALYIRCGTELAGNAHLALLSCACFLMALSDFLQYSFILDQFASFICFPLALLMLYVFPINGYPANNIYTFIFIGSEAVVLASFTARYGRSEIRPVYKGLWVSSIPIIAALTLLYYAKGYGYLADQIRFEFPLSSPYLKPLDVIIPILLEWLVVMHLFMVFYLIVSSIRSNRLRTRRRRKLRSHAA